VKEWRDEQRDVDLMGGCVVAMYANVKQLLQNEIVVYN